MSFKSFFDSKIKKMDWLDVGLIKWSCIAFGILLAIFIPQLTEINVWWIVAIIIILAIRPGYRVYIKKD
jgi:hypothetical protein